MRTLHAGVQYKMEDFMKPLQISAETAQKLPETLNLPLEQIMHLPQHILLAKIAEIQKQDQKSNLG